MRIQRALRRLSLVTLAGGAGLLVAAGVLGGCSSSYSPRASLPANLPTEPSPDTCYCPVWVPPVYRDVPKLCVKRPPCTREVPEEVLETTYKNVCVKPRCTTCACTPDMQCDQTLVQVRPGGYRWKQNDAGCWCYCYENPCYQWCNKVVTENGIQYCTEQPPEYAVVPETRRVCRTRLERIPAEYEVKWVKELYTPGHWEWQAKGTCCVPCPPAAPCPRIPFEKKPCVGITDDCPRCN